MSIRQDTRHLYLQVIEQIKRDIENGVYKEKEKLPSEFQLSKKLGVSRATLREALRILEEENIVTRRHGVGTFVNPKPVFSSGIEELISVTAMIQKSGMTPGTQFLSTDFVEPSEEDKKRFDPIAVHSLAQIERVRTADSQPVVYCIDKLPDGLIPVKDVLEKDSIFDSLEEYAGKRVSYAVTYIEPIGYHERISPVLECEPEQSLLLLKQMHYTEMDEPVLYSSNYFRADKFSFHVLRKRV
ncbi:putative HTH-type transcriptional regulator YmfC [Thalassobacillus devorans]|uniref:HTH-type transcriptional regulator YmfC n=1 Tax=Thalassobacillus devorans TaxID=279813 RepID=A0ABQ1P3E0_9BACI|nr:GntR family transcriptional regulator [Thalassobacillus devorans]NIK27968.1 GntR family transcriptional regulator [Thalassobacillus devorans]GGC89983.1 putative HTH-type transcriptional regulator YmfC [Thalassobacillus devorans]